MKERELGRPRRRWEDNIRMAIRKDEYWIHVVQDRDKWWALVKTVRKFRVLQKEMD
jgi:hypothetical protein